ncbi:S8 family peptidase [Marilutibacter chinensis]|uniref:S8 family serine peptidase n=1 Tax=Marilutibacter chinensis TaxID=2912247 RepID=A0ABS9HRA5_9GAMM|nr:S8 family serine peptidase [Lysobacter chinensis]MCF7220875.1 S8 family serine peptidase [Lysobacter chinensis]
MNRHSIGSGTGRPRARMPAWVPGRLLLTLRLGEVPEHVPGLRAVVGYGTDKAEHIDGGVIDRLLRHHGGAFRVTRLHSARKRRIERPVPGARRFDDVEQISGVARVLRIEVRDPAGVPALLQTLAEVPVVERVCLDHLCRGPFAVAADADTDRADLERVDPRTVADPRWARELLRLPEALAYEPGDPATVIGLADTGVALEHEELHARLRAGFDSVDLDPELVGGLTLVGDYRERGEQPQDEVGHGTGCAGILSAQGRGIPPGGAGACGLTPVRVLGAALGPGDRRFGVGALDNIDAGMKRLIDLNVKVVNMSFGTPESALAGDAPRPHEEVIRYALARGVILVAASGNSGLEERYYPAAHDGVIAVGAVGRDLQPASFSTRGRHVSVCAPGREILTCGLHGYQNATGTSFAAPFVAAVCALLASRAQRRAWPLDSEETRELLVESARPFGRAGVTGCGRGVVDAMAALRLLDRRIDRDLAEASAGEDATGTPEAGHTGERPPQHFPESGADRVAA